MKLYNITAEPCKLLKLSKWWEKSWHVGCY